MNNNPNSEPVKSAAEILKPCPFCNGEAEIKQYCQKGLIIKCKNCLIQKKQKVLKFSLDWLRKSLIKDWNDRRSVKDAEIAELKKQIELSVFSVTGKIHQELINKHSETIERLTEALKEIAESKGRYDSHTNARNTIEDMKELAREALNDIKK